MSGWGIERPAGPLPDMSRLLPSRSAEEMFPGYPMKLPGKPCPACDGSGVDSLADFEEFDLRKECRGLEKSLKIASRNYDDLRANAQALQARYDQKLNDTLELAEEAACLARHFKAKANRLAAELTIRVFVVLIGLTGAFWSGWMMRGIW